MLGWQDKGSHVLADLEHLVSGNGFGRLGFPVVCKEGDRENDLSLGRLQRVKSGECLGGSMVPDMWQAATQSHR